MYSANNFYSSAWAPSLNPEYSAYNTYIHGKSHVVIKGFYIGYTPFIEVSGSWSADGFSLLNLLKSYICHQILWLVCLAFTWQRDHQRPLLSLFGLLFSDGLGPVVDNFQPNWTEINRQTHQSLKSTKHVRSEPLDISNQQCTCHLQVLWIIPFEWLRWTLILVAIVISGSVLVLTFWPVVRDDTKVMAVATVATIVVLHTLLAVGCKVSELGECSLTSVVHI